MKVGQRYLKIENIGIVPIEAFVILGASLADTCVNSEISSKLIGRFGSGTKNSIAVLCREGLYPVVFSSATRLDFHLEKTTISDDISSKELERICVTYSGDCKKSSERLGMTTDFGKHIWDSVDLALREFVSNAIDFCLRKSGTWNDVEIEIVDENQVRAKSGSTRVFIPVNEEVVKFWFNLGKWFLHFSEPESLDKTVLPKTDRNFSKTRRSVVYRRGVFLREFSSSDCDSLFDYNLPDLQLDEARKASDWDVQYEATCALNKCKDPEIIERYILNTNTDKWEYSFDSYSRCSLDKELWKDVYARVIGNRVATTSVHRDRLERKGIEFHVVSAEIFSLLKDAGVKTYIDVLDSNEIDGLEFIEVPSYMIEMYGKVWDLLRKNSLTRGKEIPHLRCFVGGMDAGMTVFGLYRNGQVLLKSTLSGKELFKTIVDEFTHHCTGSEDSSRDYQEYLFDMLMVLVDKHEFQL